MSEQVGEKTEQPTPRKLEEALKKGQFPKSAEIQTVFVLGAGFFGLTMVGQESWRTLAMSMQDVLGHLHEIPLSLNVIPGHAVEMATRALSCLWPVVTAAVVGGLLAGGVQSRFQTASEALEPKLSKLNPVSGVKRVISWHGLVNAGLGTLKLVVILGLTWGVLRTVLQDPVFWTSVGLGRLGEFMSESVEKIVVRLLFAMGLIAALDYGYQFWKNQQEMMMTREEVKEETKSTEGNPQVKAQQRRRARGVAQRKMLMDVPTADVVITNPTHLAVALRYDRRTMKAPRIVAKGSRLNALRIREVARQHQVPILENKPLARLLFKHGRVGSDIPAALYAAVAEVLAWVYRVNAYRYHREQLAA